MGDEVQTSTKTQQLANVPMSSWGTSEFDCGLDTRPCRLGSAVKNLGGVCAYLFEFTVVPLNHQDEPN